MKFLRILVLLSVIPALAWAQRGGGARIGGGGFSRGGGGFARGGSISRGGGFVGGGFSRGGRIGGFNGGFRGGFRGNTIIRGGNRFVGNRYYGGRYYYPGYYSGLYFGFGYGYPYSYGYPYYDPFYYDSYYPYSYYPYYYSAPYYDAPYYGSVAYTPPAPPVAPAPPAAPTVINQTIGTGGSFYRAADYYLIAFTDHTIRAALSYNVEGDQLRYTTREHEEKTAPLDSVDRRFSEQINRDRRVEFRLP